MMQKMIHLGSVLLVAVLLATLAPAARAQALSRCSITAITESTGIVSAKVNESGAAFQFKVTDAKLLAGLHVGQDVYANFTTRQVSLDGKKMCCEITSPSQAPAPVTTPKIAPPLAGAPAPVTAPKNASPAAGAPAPVTAPPVSAPAANPAPEASAAPMAVSGTANKAAPAGPSSTITAIDAKAHVVTAKENATGKVFQFKLDDAALLNTLKVGQGVYANFDAGQVSLDGLEPSGDILRLPGSGSASGSTTTGSASTGSAATDGNSGSSNTPGSGTIYSAASLANTQVPQTLQVGGANACTKSYTSANSLLDVLVGGCQVIGGLLAIIIPTQPDTSDPTATPAGVGPYILTTGANKKVVSCGGKNAPPSGTVLNPAAFAACLKAAAYSASALLNACGIPTECPFK